MNSQQLAQACANALYERDMAAQGLGIALQSVAPGEASLTMSVRSDMLNGHAIGHGGFIFTLADTAFAYACNSQNESTVASGARIEYLAPARLEDQLTATAKVVCQRGKTGIYDVEVQNQGGELIAVFRGNSHRIKGSVIENG